MRSKLLAGGLAVTIGFLLATNPVVSEAAGQITGKQIKNNSVTGKDIKDGKLTGTDVADSSLEGKDVKDGSLALADLGPLAITGSQVSDNSLTGADIADGSLSGGDVQIRVAAANVDDNALLGGASGPVVSTSITAPVRGYLVTTASSDVYGDDVSSDCWIEVDAVEVAASERSLGNTTNVDEVDCATNAAVPVNAGPHTVQLVGSPGSSAVRFDEAALQVIFVPFGATGTTPAAKAMGGSAHAGAHGN